MRNMHRHGLWILVFIVGGTAHADGHSNGKLAIDSVAELEQAIKPSAGKTVLLRLTAERPDQSTAFAMLDGTIVRARR